MPVISARIDEATFEKFKEHLKNNGIGSHSDFIKKAVDDAITNGTFKVKDYIRLAKECLDRIEALSSVDDEVERKLIFEMGNELINGLKKDEKGRVVIKNGFVIVGITQKRNGLLKEYIKSKGYDTVEA